MCLQEKTNICFQLQESMPNTKQEIADLDGMEDIDCSLTKIRFSEDVRLVLVLVFADWFVIWKL